MKQNFTAVILTIVVVIVLAVVVSGAGSLPEPDKLLAGLVNPNGTGQTASAGTQQNGSNAAGTPVPRYDSPVAARSYEPVDLTSIEPYFEGNVQIERNGLTDTAGNKYRSGLRGYMAPGDVEKYNVDCFSIWDLGGQYRTLRATGIIRKKDKGSRYEGSYRIYGDGRLLYSRDGIGSMTKPYEVSIDITGVTDLKIEMYGNGNAGTEGINSVLVDIMLWP